MSMANNHEHFSLILSRTKPFSLEFSSVMRLHFMFQELPIDKITEYGKHGFREVERDSPKVNVCCGEDFSMKNLLAPSFFTKPS